MATPRIHTLPVTSPKESGTGRRQGRAQEVHLKTHKQLLKENLEDLYERDMSMAPLKIPLNDIYTDIEQFQIRATPYSQESVQKIISAIKAGDFRYALFNPVIVRYSEEKKLYMLAGHSRLEAYRRLSDPGYIDEETGLPLCDHPKVQEFSAIHEIDFTWIWGHVITGAERNEAKRIAAISNTLSTPESLIDRAFFYQAERVYHCLDDSMLAQKFAALEGKNRPTTLALSYLNPLGRTVETLQSFAKNDDIHKDLLKVAKWIGEARRKIPRLSNLHEDELFEWLIEHKGYGYGAGQVNTQATFLKIVSEHVHKLQDKKQFRGTTKINIMKKKRYSYALHQYEKLLEGYRKQIKQAEKSRTTVEKQVIKHNVEHNEHIINELVSSPVHTLIDRMAKQTENILQMKLNLELAEKLRFEFTGRDKARFLAAQELLGALYIQKEGFKETRNKYIDAAKSQTDLFAQFDESCE